MSPAVVIPAAPDCYVTTDWDAARVEDVRLLPVIAWAASLEQAPTPISPAGYPPGDWWAVVVPARYMAQLFSLGGRDVSNGESFVIAHFQPSDIRIYPSIEGWLIAHRRHVAGIERRAN